MRMCSPEQNQHFSCVREHIDVYIRLWMLTFCCWSVFPVQHSCSYQAECQTSEKQLCHSHPHSRLRPSHQMDPERHRSHCALARYEHKWVLISTQMQTTRLHSESITAAVTKLECKLLLSRTCSPCCSNVCERCASCRHSLRQAGMDSPE